MKISHNQEGDQGFFYFLSGDKKIGEMTYSIKNKKLMVIDHTEVDKLFRGKKIGYELVEAGVAFARQKNYKILPLCAFAKKMTGLDPDKYSDVLTA